MFSFFLSFFQPLWFCHVFSFLITACQSGILYFCCFTCPYNAIAIREYEHGFVCLLIWHNNGKSATILLIIFKHLGAHVWLFSEALHVVRIVYSTEYNKHTPKHTYVHLAAQQSRQLLDSRRQWRSGKFERCFQVTRCTKKNEWDVIGWSARRNNLCFRITTAIMAANGMRSKLQRRQIIQTKKMKKKRDYIYVVHIRSTSCEDCMRAAFCYCRDNVVFLSCWGIGGTRGKTRWAARSWYYDSAVWAVHLRCGSHSWIVIAKLQSVASCVGDVDRRPHTSMYFVPWAETLCERKNRFEWNGRENRLPELCTKPYSHRKKNPWILWLVWCVIHR